MSLFARIATASLAASGVAAWSCSEGDTAAELSLVSIGDIDDKAVCNDGTPGGYYLKTNPDSDLWLVYLAGGAWCYDVDSCDERYQEESVGQGGYDGIHHMSSSTWDDTCVKTGLFDEDSGLNPALAAANKAYIPYCTSDAHMGDREASDETGGWAFRGQRIVRAVLRDLVENQGLGSGGGEKGEGGDDVLLLGGGSAGGRGAMAHLDLLAAREGDYAVVPEAVRVLGFLDSNLWMDVKPYNETFNGFPAQTEDVYSFAGARGLADAACAAAYPGDEGWKCLLGEYRMPFVGTPYLMAHSQYDSWQLKNNEQVDYDGSNYDADMLAYAEDFGDYSRRVIGGLPAAPGDARSAVWAPACYQHHRSESADFWDLSADGGSQSDALVAFLARNDVGDAAAADYDDGKSPLRWVDDCGEMDCGDGCSATDLL